MCNSFAQSNECLQADMNQSTAISVIEHRKWYLEKATVLRDSQVSYMYVQSLEFRGFYNTEMIGPSSHCKYDHKR